MAAFLEPRFRYCCWIFTILLACLEFDRVQIRLVEKKYNMYLVGMGRQVYTVRTRVESWAGPKADENFGLNSGLRRAFCLRCTKI